MRKLIQDVRVEAVKAIEALDADDKYQRDQIATNEEARKKAQARIAACDRAIDAIDTAERSLTAVQ